MRMHERPARFVLSAFLFVAFQLLAITARAKPTVTFVSPCECIGNHGVSRWAAKIDPQEPPSNAADIKRVTPAQITAWPGPGHRIGQRSERTAAENQWYAVTGRLEKVRVEDDGDVHIELRDVGNNAGIVVELPLGPRWCEMRKTVFSWTDARFPVSPGRADKFRLTQHPVITVIGKAFYDIDHSGNDTHNNRRNYDQSLAVWEIHPVMKMTVGGVSSTSAAAATSSAPEIQSPTPEPTPTQQLQPTTAPAQFVTLTRPVTIQIPFGATVLQPGTKLPVLSRDGQTVDVRYMDARYSIPISSTDLH